MNEKFNKSNDLNQGDLDNENYSVNFDEGGQKLYVPEGGSRHVRLWFFIFLALFIVMMIGYRFYTNLYDPLKYDVPDFIEEQINAEEQAARTIAELRESDTDQDGLTDYQEIYQYYTSIFLPDTDSDGFTDSEEVNLGEDPTCPRGESCNLLRLITPNTKLASIVEDISLDPSLTVQEAAVKEFRKFLLDNGMDQADLDTLTDEDLLAIFRIVDESDILDQGQLNASTTPDEIRNFLLLLPGVDQNEINAMSDEELQQIADDLINR